MDAFVWPAISIANLIPNSFDFPAIRVKNVLPNSAALEAFQEYLMGTFQSNQRDDQRETDVLDAEIARNQKRLQNTKQMRLDGEFDVAEYKER